MEFGIVYGLRAWGVFGFRVVGFRGLGLLYRQSAGFL